MEPFSENSPLFNEGFNVEQCFQVVLLIAIALLALLLDQRLDDIDVDLHMHDEHPL
jgi:hypothetical protein